MTDTIFRSWPWADQITAAGILDHAANLIGTRGLSHHTACHTTAACTTGPICVPCAITAAVTAILTRTTTPTPTTRRRRRRTPPPPPPAPDPKHLTHIGDYLTTRALDSLTGTSPSGEATCHQLTILAAHLRMQATHTTPGKDNPTHEYRTGNNPNPTPEP